MKRWLAFFLILALLAAMVPMATAASALPTEAKFAKSIAAFRAEFPLGSYWNDANGTIQEGRYQGSSLVGDQSCIGASCGSLAIKGKEYAWQCHGYAMLLSDRIFGSFYNIDKEHWVKTSYTLGKFSGKLYAGDVVRLILPSGTAHSVFLYKVTTKAVYYTDCNRIGSCKLDWNMQTRADFEKRISYVLHYDENNLKGSKTTTEQLTISYHANGGVVANADQTVDYYKILTDAGLNLRAQPKTAGKKVSALPKGAEFQIRKTREADGYIWGLTTYNGVAGWCVISEPKWVSVRKVPATEYAINEDGLIYTTDDGKIYQEIRFAGTTYEAGVASVSQLDLEKEGYLFMGWSLQPSRGRLYHPEDPFLPEKLCPELSKGDQEVILYARWKDLSEPPFADVGKSAWYYEGVKYTYQKGWMNGLSETAFGPQETTTRAMVVTVLYRMEGSPAVSEKSAFTDVPAGKWYADAVNWAADQKIVNGMGDGTFAPTQEITRAQMAAILFRYAQAKKKENAARDSLKSFADRKTLPDWAKEPMQWAVANEIINGIETAGKADLQPSGNANRAQIATVLMRYAKSVLEME